MSIRLSLQSWPKRRGRARWGRLELALLGLFALLLLLHCTRGWGDQAEALGRWAERVAAGRGPRLQDVVAVSMWWATAVNLLLAAALAVTRPLWWGGEGGWRGGGRGGFPVGAAFWIAMGLAVALGGALRVPRMGVSLYSDEEYTLRTYLMGRWVEAESGEMEFRRVGWDATFWGNREGNNHVLFSVASRCCLDAWRWVSGGGPGSFSEGAMRLPSLLAGCAGIVALGLALRALGMPRAGAIGAFLAAVHPWHIRYSTEGRGYGLVLLFAPLLVVTAAWILRDGRWRWWLGYALMLVALMMSFPGALALPVALSLALLAAAVLGAYAGIDGRDAVARFAVSHALALMLFLQFMAPSIPQIREFLRLDRMRGALGWEWLVSIWSHLATGIDWRFLGENPIVLSVRGMGWPSGPLATLLVVALVPALVCVGVARLGMLGRGPLLLGLALAGCGPLACVQHAIARSNVLAWYMIFALPGLLLLVAAALGPWAESDPRGASRRVPFWGSWRGRGMIFVLLFLVATHRQTWLIMRHPKEELRGVAALVRGTPEEGGIGVVFWTNAPVYAPGLRVVWSAAELWRWMERASDEGRPLRVGYGHRPSAVQSEETRALLALAEDPHYFETLRVFPGLEEDQFTHHVNVLKSGRVAPVVDRVDAMSEGL